MTRASGSSDGSDSAWATPGGRAARLAAALAATGFATLAVFQAALAAGVLAALYIVVARGAATEPPEAGGPT